MATEFAVQVIPNRFPGGELGRSSVPLSLRTNHCKTISCDGAPGRIRTLNLLIRSLRPLDCRQFAVEGRGAIGAPVLASESRKSDLTHCKTLISHICVIKTHADVIN